MYGASHGFLDLPSADSDLAAARYAVLPIPYEGTVSYQRGTADGPGAIIEASAQVQTYDEQLGGEFISSGIATLAMVHPSPGVEDQIRRVAEAASGPLEAGKFLLSLGGEHSITAALVSRVAEVHGEISVLQIDAHADLRDSYDGTRYSHACVMRRVLETAERICQVGVRSFSAEEAAECPEQVARFITPAEVDGGSDWIDRALAMLGEKVYVTVDIDGFDPSIAPGTGCPEPGGLGWQPVLALLRRVCAEREVVSADIVEVRPIPPNHVTECLAAHLAYKIIAYTHR